MERSSTGRDWGLEYNGDAGYLLKTMCACGGSGAWSFIRRGELRVKLQSEVMTYAGHNKDDLNSGIQ